MEQMKDGVNKMNKGIYLTKKQALVLLEYIFDDVDRLNAVSIMSLKTKYTKEEIDAVLTLQKVIDKLLDLENDKW